MNRDFDLQHRSGFSANRGFGLVELMVAIVVSLLIMAAILQLYVDITRSNSELAKTNALIENGRFAMQVLQSDIAHAGFWGELDNDVPGALAIPDLCDLTGWPAAVENLIGIPVQGFADGTTLTGCGVSNVLAGSQVLAIMRANTCVFDAASCADSGPHIQISGCRNDTPEEPYLISANTADFTLRKKSCLATVAERAPRRRVVSNIYYLANSNGQPTLMRVSLVNGVYQNPQPLVEGVEALRFEYGIDNLGRNGLPISALNPGDGSADEFVTCAPCTLAQLSNVVAVKVYVLVRNLEATPGYVDGKTYQLGDLTIAAANDGFKRHVFSTTVRLVNPSGRREQP